MTYRELLELYKNGKLPEDKRRELEAEIEKQDAISEYLYEEAEIPDLSFDSESELAALIETVGCGMVAQADSKDELKNAIHQIVTDSDLSIKGKLGKTYLQTELNKEKCVKMYVDTITSVMENKDEIFVDRNGAQ